VLAGCMGAERDLRVDIRHADVARIRSGSGARPNPSYREIDRKHLFVVDDTRRVENFAIWE
jgi:hypothetical protein